MVLGEDQMSSSSLGGGRLFFVDFCGLMVLDLFGCWVATSLASAEFAINSTGDT